LARVGRNVAAADWSRLRLTDRIERGVRVLLVGINPGVRSALTGHHFAGPSNRFWKLLFESRLVPQALTFLEDGRLPEFGFGITNLVARPSPGIDDLKPAEYLGGWTILQEKIRTFRPTVVALVGVTLYRAIRPLVEEAGGRLSKSRPNFSYAEMLAAFKALKRALRA
jgi:TDG/mug DNA glycosylase family protein